MSTMDTSGELPIVGVTLYTSGVGYFERKGEVDGDERRTLYFPVEQINDVLKSLTLYDHGAESIRPVTYAAQEPMDKALQAFSVDVSDNPSRAEILNRTRGAEVELTIAEGAGKSVIGTILGVEEHVTVHADPVGRTTDEIANVITDDGVRAVNLGNVEAIRFLDAKLAAEIRQALAIVAKGRDGSKRPLTLSFDGDGRRQVEVGYLVETPVWQTTYRLVLGDKPRLQGWALVQNTGQDDWKDATLTLVSGRPISFRQDLYTPLYLTRPSIAPRLDASQRPVAYGAELYDEDADMPVVAAAADTPRGGKQLVGVANVRQRKQEALKVMPEYLGAAEEQVRRVDLSAVQAGVETTGAELGTALFAYRIDEPVSVPRQESAMIPFVSAEIEANPVSVYRESVRAGNPLLGARLKNNTGLHLMGGPLTVFASTPSGETGYTGDALIDDTEPDQSRLITYAVDLAVDASNELTSRFGDVRSVKIGKGMVEVEEHTEIENRYRFKNHDTLPRTIIVEHPFKAGHGFVLVSPEPREQTADLYRFEVPVEPGASAELLVRQNLPRAISVSLAKTLPDTFLRYARQGTCSAEVREALERVAERRAATAKLEEEIRRVETLEKSIGDGQERIRKNMENLDNKSDLYRRYVAELTDQEDKIRALGNEATELKVELKRRQDELSDYIDTLSLQ